MSDPNLVMLEEAATKLAVFLDDVVFVGGATVGMLVTDKAAASVRATRDVDVIAEIFTHIDYADFSDRLRKAAFLEDTGAEAITCRWRNGDLILDVLPLRQEVLGYSNCWYEGAFGNALIYKLPSGKSIKVIASPYFLGTKMEAFRGRGNNDYLASHDLEDFVAVIDGRDSILEEIVASQPDIRAYLAYAASSLLRESRFIDALPGYVLDEGRELLIIARLKAISQLSE